MRTKVGDPITETPGPRLKVLLDVAEESLPVLREGVEAESVRLAAQDDGSYRLQIVNSHGGTVSRGIKPSVTILAELLDEWAETWLTRDDVPQEVQESWDRMVDSFEQLREEGQRT
jgi:hypothetical protein